MNALINDKMFVSVVLYISFQIIDPYDCQLL